MSRFFDIKEIKEIEKQDGITVSAIKKLDPSAKKRYLKNLRLGYKMAKSLNDLCEYPSPGEQWLIVTEKQFNAFALVLSIIENQLIEELYFAIYRINEPTVNALIAFIDAGKIKRGLFIISNFFNQTKKPEKWALKLIDYCEHNADFDCVFTHNHAKILCLKAQSDYYVFEGSGNMSDNARIEQYRYENSVESYNFHKKWMTKLL